MLHSPATPEIQRLMGCFLFLGRLENSPYSSLLDPTLWAGIIHDFTRECCQLFGLSHESPLFVASTLGAILLPHGIKFKTILPNKPWDPSISTVSNGCLVNHPP